jgi:hypothetical protein
MVAEYTYVVKTKLLLLLTLQAHCSEHCDRLNTDISNLIWGHAKAALKQIPASQSKMNPNDFFIHNSYLILATSYKTPHLTLLPVTALKHQSPMALFFNHRKRKQYNS